MNASIVNLHIKPTAGAADEALAVSTSVVQLTSANWHPSTRYIVVQCKTNSINYTVDGSDPSASNGFTMTAGTTAEWSRAWATAAKFIRVSADAVIHAQEATD